LNDGQIPNFRGVRVALSTGCNDLEGNRRTSRNGRVSEIPNVTIRNFVVAVQGRYLVILRVLVHPAHRLLVRERLPQPVGRHNHKLVRCADAERRLQHNL
jgi:hypothetical protein